MTTLRTIDVERRGDIRLAAEDAKLAANFVRLGLSPGMGTTYFLPRLLGWSRAMELLLTGRALTGREAAAIGLVSRAVPAADLEAAAMTLAEELALSAPIAVRLAKRAARDALGYDPRTAIDREAHDQARTVESADLQE